MKTVATVGSALLLLVGPSRDWTWPAAWVTVLAASALVLLPIYLYLLAFNPDLIEERERFLGNKGTAGFEVHLVPAVVGLIPVRFLAAGVQHHLQLQQPGWSATPLLSTPGQQAAAAVLLFSYFLQTWSVCTNKYFSSVVRIQSDRGHKVCSSGPYAYIRHPGYVAFSLQGVAESVLLESSWSMLFAVLKLVVLVIRTVKENAFLKASLPGYAAYAHKVPYSWVPYLW
jgi:protein-S-isoprenylcysteine O-methyltransferase Ste14